MPRSSSAAPTTDLICLASRFTFKVLRSQGFVRTKTNRNILEEKQVAAIAAGTSKVKHGFWFRECRRHWRVFRILNVLERDRTQNRYPLLLIAL
jgi:hypothetical protein